MYGGSELTENYALSPSVKLMFVPGGHDFHLPPQEWDLIARWLTVFCAGAPGRGLAYHSAFDEAAYLQANPDVDQAVAAGTFLSGEQHYQSCGRRERRAYRLAPRNGIDVELTKPRLS